MKPSGNPQHESGAAHPSRPIRRRITSGLLFVLPALVTFWVLFWLYSVLRSYAIDPLARLVVYLAQGQQRDEDLWPLFEEFIAPLIAVAVLLLLLYALGSFVGARLAGAIDRLLLRVPLVTAIHNMVGKIFQSFQGPADLERFKRVVLIPFPQPKMRAIAFVTGSCEDKESGKRILCVYVPTTPMPASGYMLLVPEGEVTELDWTLEETLQAIISGGISAPPQVRYFAAELPTASDRSSAASVAPTSKCIWHDDCSNAAAG